MTAEWKKDSDVIFERFAAGIDDAVSKGEELKCADRDVQYGIRLQNERIRKSGITFHYNLTPRGHFTEGLSLGYGSMWGDNHYTSRLEARTCLKQETFYKDGTPIYGKKQNVTMVQTVTDVRNPQEVAEDIYICPDCGAPTRIGRLMEGCPSCGNKFRMSELYPKISNYYFHPDVGGTRSEMARIAVPSILISSAACYSFFLLLGGISLLSGAMFSMGQNTYQAGQSLGNALGFLFGGFFIAAFMGPLIGWFITSFIYIARLSSFAAQRIPMAKYLGSQKNFEDFMKQSTPEFSYEFFAGKAVSYIKLLIFSERPEELPFYNGGALNPGLKDIVDVSSMGAVGIVNMEVEGDYAVVYADVFLEDTYYTDGKIARVNEVFNVVMKKNISRLVDMNFKITGIHCPTCGGSFDATQNRICPYCGNAYKAEDIDWSVELLQRKQ